MARYYSAYGLRLRSEIDLLLPADRSASGEDIVIRLGEIDNLSSLPMTRGNDGVQYGFQGPDALVLHWDIIGSYRISSGREILIQPNTPLRYENLRQPLLGTVMAVALQQRGCLVLHGSAISVGGKSIIFTGDKGEGKSTLASWLNQQGTKLLSDDVCAMNCREGAPPTLRPSFPRIKLHADAMQFMGKNPADYPQVHPEVPKYVQDVSTEFCGKTQPVGAICTLRTGEKLSLEPLYGMEAMKEILRHMLINRFPDHPIELRKEIFSQSAYLSRIIPVYSLTRPRDLQRLPDIARLLEQLAARRFCRPL